MNQHQEFSRFLLSSQGMGFLHVHLPAISASGQHLKNPRENQLLHDRIHPNKWCPFLGKVNVCRDDRYVGRFGKGLHGSRMLKIGKNMVKKCKEKLQKLQKLQKLKFV